MGSKKASIDNANGSTAAIGNKALIHVNCQREPCIDNNGDEGEGHYECHNVGTGYMIIIN